MIEKLNLPQEMKQTILKEYWKRQKFFDYQAGIAYTGDLPDYPIAKRSPLERAILLLRCVAPMYERYKAEGVPEEIIWDTFSDISLRLDLYWKRYKKPGLSKDDVIWFRHLWHCEIFQIGSLQYQKFHMIYLDRDGCGEDYMQYPSEQKKNLLQGTPVWNVHVPKGTDLSPAIVTESIRRAMCLLPVFFPAHQAEFFLCYSWLLYPGLLDLLPKGSNIRSFAQRFTIISSVQDPQEAIYNIYGKHYPRKNLYPQHTALQRAAIGHFSQLGYACGLIPFTKGSGKYGNQI